jgi:hypothetical protein
VYLKMLNITLDKELAEELAKISRELGEKRAE